MESIFEWLLQRANPQWVLGAIVVYLLLDKTGFIQRWFKGRSEERVSTADRISEDTQKLIANLERIAEHERSWRQNNDIFYREEIDRLRGLLVKRDQQIDQFATSIDNATEAAKLSERGNSRLRHAINNLMQRVSDSDSYMRQRGVEPPPWAGWKDLYGLDKELDENIRRLFGDQMNGDGSAT